MPSLFSLPEENITVSIALDDDVDFKKIDPLIIVVDRGGESVPSFGEISLPKSKAVEIIEKLKHHPNVFQIAGEWTAAADAYYNESNQKLGNIKVVSSEHTVDMKKSLYVLVKEESSVDIRTIDPLISLVIPCSWHRFTYLVSMPENRAAKIIEKLKDNPDIVSVSDTLKVQPPSADSLPSTRKGGGRLISKGFVPR